MGKCLDGLIEADHLTLEPAVVSVSLEKINRVLGTNISEKEVVDIFNRLKFGVAVEERDLYCHCSDASWRYYD